MNKKNQLNWWNSSHLILSSSNFLIWMYKLTNSYTQLARVGSNAFFEVLPLKVDGDAQRFFREYPEYASGSLLTPNMLDTQLRWGRNILWFDYEHAPPQLLWSDFVLAFIHAYFHFPGEGVFPIMDYTRMLRPKGVPFWAPGMHGKGVHFSGWRYVKGVPF